MARAEDIFARWELEGLSYVQELLATSKSEEAFLDFKRSANDGAGDFLDPRDRSNLSRAVSGFANSDGGVVIWGIGTAGKAAADAASYKKPLVNCARFAGQIDAAVSGCTVPPVQGVRSIPVALDTTGQGFCATLIPASRRPPHQDIEEKRYYIRSGSSFQPASHGIVAALFAHRSHAELKISFIPRKHGGVPAVEVKLRNVGRGVARGAYILLSHVPNVPAVSGNVGGFTRRFEVPGWNAFASTMQDVIYPGVPIQFVALQGQITPGGYLNLPTVDLRYRVGAADIEEIDGTVVVDFRTLTVSTTSYGQDTT